MKYDVLDVVIANVKRIVSAKKDIEIIKLQERKNEEIRQVKKQKNETPIQITERDELIREEYKGIRQKTKLIKELLQVMKREYKKREREMEEEILINIEEKIKESPIS